MKADRYLKVVLTIIALELGWMAIRDSGVELYAQRKPDPTPVIIQGIEILPNKETTLPVALVSAAGPIRVNSDRPLEVDVPRPVTVQAEQPLVVATGQRPLLIQSVPAVPAALPGPGR